uniref:Uncharacterized protein n=1 Tax=Meloidogyne hapla TaxID=6305 RepID=A0A1I8BUX9_MELHA
MAKEQVEWNYMYEWNNGVLLRADELVKITLIRLQGEPNVIELSGRIDTEEAAEEELQERRDSNEQQIEDGLDCSPPSCPLKRVWPFLVRIFQPLLFGIDSYKTLPFNLSLVFVGECFFTCPEGAQKLTARSLDAIQTLSSIQRIKNVRFKADQDQIYSLNLDQCFPGTTKIRQNNIKKFSTDFRPTKMTDFSPDNFPLPKQQQNHSQTQGNTSPLSPLLFSSSSTSDEPATSATSLGDSRVQSPRTVTEKKRVDRSPSCVPSFDSKIEQICSSPSPQPQHCLNVEGQTSGYKNRGRRVSFGIIHSIPNTSSSTTGGGSSPLLMNISSNFSLSGERKCEEESEENSQNEEKTKSALVENIVDEMLQKAIDQVFIKE